MREYGIPKLLTWRWTPFAALVLGSLSFIGFVMLVIPDRIGNAVSTSGNDSSAASLTLGSRGLSARTQTGSTPASNWSNDDHSSGTPAPSPVSNAATQSAEFPRRGFSPPLERSEPPPPPQPFQPPQGQTFTPPPQPNPPPPPPPAVAAFTAPLPPPQAPDAAPPPPPAAPQGSADQPEQPAPGSVMPQPN